MGDTRLVWAVVAPSIAALLSAFLMLTGRRAGLSSGMGKWFDVAALLAACGGLLVEGPLLWGAHAEASLLGLTLAANPLAPAILLSVYASLLCALFIGRQTGYPPWAVVPTGSLLTAALVVQEPVVRVLCLFGAALLVAGLALGQSRPGYIEDDAERTMMAVRVAGLLKYLAGWCIGVGLLLVGVLLPALYRYNLEDRGLLQTGLAALSVGLAVCAGTMPFSAGWYDMVTASPGAATVALGAVAPSTLAVGLLILAPTAGGLHPPASLAWLGVAGVLLAGLRAVGTETSWRRQVGADSALPAAMSVALSLGWALFGVLLGSRTGASGAMLVAVNLALAVPLLTASGELRRERPRLAAVGTAVGALSLLGLPPFGGSVGTLLLAQAAVGAGGVWLFLLLLGTLLAAGGWLRWAVRPQQPMGEERRSTQAGRLGGLRRWFASPLPLLVCVLIAAQIALFFLSNQIAVPMLSWANVPWTALP